MLNYTLVDKSSRGGAGARRMCDEGALESPEVTRIFGLHVFPHLPTGHIASAGGTLLAAVGMLEIMVTGRGGHAGMPHTTIDPVITAAKIVVELQTIVSREVDPAAPSVVSVTSIRGGEAFNVIPDSVVMTGTIRSLTMEGIHFLRTRIRDIASSIAEANRCCVSITFPEPHYPPTINDASLWREMKDAASSRLSLQNIHELPPIMGGEDFAYYQERILGLFIALGVKNDSVGTVHGLHSPKFNLDEAALPLGAALHVTFALM
jgi:IAA-amino acid hydrolase